MRVALAACLVLGCGRIDFETSSSPGDSHSGSRLELEEYDFGTSRVAGDYYFDALRGEECSPFLAADGQTYCMPRAPYVQVGYVDAGCTMPVALAQTPCFTSAYFHVQEASFCTSTSRTFAMGSERTLAQYYSRTPTGACVGPSPPAGAVFDFGPEIPLTELVLMTRERERLSSRLERVMFTTADGFRAAALDEYFDTALETVCYGQTNSYLDGFPRPSICRPDRVAANPNVFADASCTIPATTLESCPAVPRFGSLFDQCFDESIYDLIEITGPAYVALDASTCGQVSVADPYLAFITPSDVMRTSYALPPGTDRIVRLVQSLDGIEAGAATLFDRVLDVPCIIDDPSGTCVPLVASFEHAYSDTGCTAPIDVALLIGFDGCDQEPPKYVTETNGCTKDLYPVTGVRTDPFYQLNPTCIQVKPASPLVAYDVGAQVTDLAHATTRVIPAD